MTKTINEFPDNLFANLKVAFDDAKQKLSEKYNLVLSKDPIHTIEDDQGDMLYASLIYKNISYVPQFGTNESQAITIRLSLKWVNDDI